VAVFFIIQGVYYYDPESLLQPVRFFRGFRRHLTYVLNAPASHVWMLVVDYAFLGVYVHWAGYYANIPCGLCMSSKTILLRM
jgi:hypothetical protein